ncbi:MAG: anti-sigma factor [Myxococcota bacterium]|nr:anti-sigma factor [Myxococcota bacterium]
MNHSDVRNHMADYLEGDLPLGPRALFDAHLDECAECAQEIEHMRLTIGALRSLPDPEPPPMLVHDVMRRIRLGEAHPTWGDRVRSFFDFLLSPKVLAPISAAAIAAGIVIGTQPLRDFIERGGVLNEQAAVPSVRIQIAGLPVEAAGAGAVLERPRTLSPGAEMVARSQMFQERPARTRFSDWTSVESFPSGGAVAPGIAVASRSGPMGSSELARGAWTPSAYLPARTPMPTHAWPSADEWLDIVEEQPGEFADRMAARSLAEREHWIESLSRRAAERGRLQAIVYSLRSSSNPLAHSLADEMATSGAGYGGGTLSVANEHGD